jgi:2-amino-4-hydroxy-6-hydroxymethyldihydropteridine diphosphokinase
MNFPPNTTTDPTRNDFKDVAFISLGSNLPSTRGSSVDTLEHAIDCLQNLSQVPLLRSSIWISEPVDCPENSPKFANAAIGLCPLEGESPESLLSKMLEMESMFGRKRSGIVNEPRVLDLDLISYGDQLVASDNLKIPHPEAQSRSFVLFPLDEIAPGLVFRGQDKSVAELAKRMRQAGQAIVKIPS